MTRNQEDSGRLLSYEERRILKTTTRRKKSPQKKSPRKKGPTSKPIASPTQAPLPVPIAVEPSIVFFNGLDLSQQYKMCSLRFASTSIKRQGKGGKDGKGESSGKSGKSRNLQSRKESSKKYKGSDDALASDLVEPTVSASAKAQVNFPLLTLLYAELEASRRGLSRNVPFASIDKWCKFHEMSMLKSMFPPVTLIPETLLFLIYLVP